MVGSADPARACALGSRPSDRGTTLGPDVCELSEVSTSIDRVTQGPPAPRSIVSSALAVENAVEWMRHWGYADAHAPKDPVKEGPDVVADHALALVKFEARHADAPVLRELVDDRANSDTRRLFAFTGVGFTHSAVTYANDFDIALFQYSFSGLVTPASTAAHTVVDRPRLQPQAATDVHEPPEHPRRSEEGDEDSPQESPSPEGKAQRPASPTPAGPSEISCLAGTIGIAALGMAIVSLGYSVINLWRLLTDGGVRWWEFLASLALALAFFFAIAKVAEVDERRSRHGLALPTALFGLVTYIWFSDGYVIPVVITGSLTFLSVIGWLLALRHERPVSEASLEEARLWAKYGVSQTTTTVGATGSATTSSTADVPVPSPFTAPLRDKHAQQGPDDTTVPLASAPSFSRVRVLDLGSAGQLSHVPETTDDQVVVWTGLEPDEKVLATVGVRGVLDETHGLVWLPADARVEVVDWVRFAGDPQDLVEATAPKGSVWVGDDQAPVKAWPAIIAASELVSSAVSGEFDAETSVEVILCALAVAPDWDPTVDQALRAALAKHYVDVVDDPETYPPDQYPWRQAIDRG